MAVLESNGTVVYSHGHQWAALPGVMIARGVQQDLSRDGLFQVVVAEMPDLDTDYELSGRVLTVGCQPGFPGSSGRISAGWPEAGPA